jgi:hypothetical protein
MTIEEMCEFVRVITNNEHLFQEGDAIITALKAAQAMHKGYTILERQGRQCGFLDSRDHEKLLKAWEVATEKT